MTIRRRLAVASALLSVLALAGCATPTVGPGASGTTPPPPAATADGAPSAAWLDDGRMIGLVTYGSSTCVPSAEDVRADGQTVTVVLVDPEAKACTRDLVPRATAIGVPESVDTSKDVTIVVTGAVEGSAELDGAEGLVAPGTMTDYAPSAGWSSESSFVVLTWGSSGCQPAIDGIAATGEHALELTFVDFPADQVCTADMAPRVVVAEVPDRFGDEDDVTLTLAGAGITGTTTILGDR